MQPWFTVYFFGIEHPCYDQLTPVKTRYPLTSITWPYRGLKLTTKRGQVFFEVDRWPGAGFSIGSRAHVWLTCWKQGRILRKPVNAHPGLNVNRIITFSSMQMFLLLFVYMVIITYSSWRFESTKALSSIDVKEDFFRLLRNKSKV